jgi:hypothetical protein
VLVVGGVVVDELEVVGALNNRNFSPVHIFMVCGATPPSHALKNNK